MSKGTVSRSNARRPLAEGDFSFSAANQGEGSWTRFTVSVMETTTEGKWITHRIEFNREGATSLCAFLNRTLSER